jgi:thioredoxin reductase (NADPH)
MKFCSCSRAEIVQYPLGAACFQRSRVLWASVTSTLTFCALLAIALLIYWLWERSDRQKEAVARRIAADVRAMGDVVAQSLSPRILPELCIGSGACVSACPEASVIALVDGRAQLVNPLGCIGHGSCA